MASTQRNKGHLKAPHPRVTGRGAMCTPRHCAANPSRSFNPHCCRRPNTHYSVWLLPDKPSCLRVCTAAAATNLSADNLAGHLQGGGHLHTNHTASHFQGLPLMSPHHCRSAAISCPVRSLIMLLLKLFLRCTAPHIALARHPHCSGCALSISSAAQTAAHTAICQTAPVAGPFLLDVSTRSVLLLWRSWSKAFCILGR